MVDFDTREEWASFFEEKFPDGALVTVARNSATDAMYDDSPQFISARISLSDFENGTPEIVVVDYDTDAVFRFDIDKVEEEDPRKMVLLTIEGRHVIFSNQMSSVQKELLRERREGGIWS